MEKLQQNPAIISNAGKHNHASSNTSKVTERLKTSVVKTI